MKKYDVLIVGAGITGACLARELSRYQLKVAVCEKENDVSCGTTKANSAIVHAGYDPLPGTKMAKHNVAGSRMIPEMCRELDVLYKECGSLVVAFSPEQCRELEELYRRGQENGVQQLSLLDRETLFAWEPNLNENACGALYAPTAGVIDPWGFAIALCENALHNGVDFYLNSAVCGLRKNEEGYEVQTVNPENPVLHSRYIVNAAGVSADDVHAMLGERPYEIWPAKGQYYLLDKSESGFVEHVIFQCPTAAGKGVLISPTVHGNIIVGPDSQPIEPHRKTDVSVDADGLAAVAETARKTSKKVNIAASIRNFAGLRATIPGHNDFWISEDEAHPGFIDVAGIKSPGLTAAPSVALEVVDLLREAGLEIKKKPEGEFDPLRHWICFREESEEAQAALIEQDPLYGRIICRCEEITEAEIIKALGSPLTPPSLDAVKRRCGSGMGRCQGGFCGPRIARIIARERGIPMEEVLQDKNGSYLLIGPTKSEEA